MLKQIITLIAFLMLAACSSTTYTTQESDEAFVQLQGNFNNTVLAIDDVQVNIDEDTETFELNGVKVAKFPITLGAHQVVVYRSGKVVFNKKIFVAHGQTVEVIVP